MKYLLLFLASSLLLFGCENKVPNQETKITVKNHAVESLSGKSAKQKLTKKVYVPVYSNIYQSTRNDRTSLTSTLSIHNTSETDTLFITRIDYFDTQGKLVKKYLENPIYVNTFETIEYVVDEKDDSGGSGANFVVEWYGSEKLNPLFQAVMIGGLGSKSFSFTTEGVYFE
ncbi:DUF3124 domain-containing protein [Brumimicrobium oceani]|uniref:DUF3124 domain-containing protein n=1 Tax=Brumimicrobium oceani TaxID=2100725 RepID=A0A2U2XFS2_9FLAO|nr:DUF3124 domain-containing protein [Brumimicrobium oceani]PWH86597.1 hypothetical protein DIT68_05015 [Brumimicrobium oceani]